MFHMFLSLLLILGMLPAHAQRGGNGQLIDSKEETQKRMVASSQVPYWHVFGTSYQPGTPYPGTAAAAPAPRPAVLTQPQPAPIQPAVVISIQPQPANPKPIETKPQNAVAPTHLSTVDKVFAAILAGTFFSVGDLLPVSFIIKAFIKDSGPKASLDVKLARWGRTLSFIGMAIGFSLLGLTDSNSLVEKEIEQRLKSSPQVNVFAADVQAEQDWYVLAHCQNIVVTLVFMALGSSLAGISSMHHNLSVQEYSFNSLLVNDSSSRRQKAPRVIEFDKALLKYDGYLGFLRDTTFAGGLGYWGYKAASWVYAGYDSDNTASVIAYGSLALYCVSQGYLYAHGAWSYLFRKA